MALERGHKFNQEWHQALAADAIGRRPGGDQRLLDLDVVHASPCSANGFRRLDRPEQQTDGVLAFVARDGDELVEDGRTLAVPCGAIARLRPAGFSVGWHGPLFTWPSETL